MNTDLAAAGQLALDTALATWRRRIVDPPRRSLHDPAYEDDRAAIDAMIRARAGLGWARCSTLRREYRRDGDYEWCGAFAATCWRAAGLDPELARVYWSSTYRLDRYGSRRIAFGSPGELRLRKRLPGDGRGFFRMTPEMTSEDVERWGPRAGDVLLVDTVGGWSYGHHVTLVERVEGATAYTVEGNATGTGPDGTIYQGVIRRTRDMSTWRRFIRPALGDLTEAS